jgi:hypothetical protein
MELSGEHGGIVAALPLDMQDGDAYPYEHPIDEGVARFAVGALV